MTNEIREAAAKALLAARHNINEQPCASLIGMWGPFLAEEALREVDAVAPLLEGPLQREVEELRQAIERARTYTGFEGWACPLCTYDNGVFVKCCAIHEQVEALRQERDRAQADAMAEYWIDRDRLTAAEAQLAAAKDVVGKIRERSVGHDANSVFGELWDALADIHTLAASVVPSEGRPG